MVAAGVRLLVALFRSQRRFEAHPILAVSSVILEKLVRSTLPPSSVVFERTASREPIRSFRPLAQHKHRFVPRVLRQALDCGLRARALSSSALQRDFASDQSHFVGAAAELEPDPAGRPPR